MKWLNGFTGAWVLGLASVLCGPALAPQLKAQQAAANPAMWMVKGVHGTVYLFGTVHVMRKNVQWETPKIAAALKSSDVLYLEIPGVDEAAAAAAQPIVMQYGIDPEHPLSTKITKEDAALLDTALKSMGITEQQIEPMKPWLVYLTLSVLPSIRSGYDPTSGIDKAIETEARSENKLVRGFETVTDQVKMLSGFSDAQQVELLHQELVDLPESTKKMDEIVTDWELGNVDKIGEIDNGEMKAKHPDVYAKLLVDRNIHFTDVIAAMLKDPHTGTVFVAIGAAHFAGPDSVVKMLQKQGFNVTRVE
jgi:uncharacterized protein YbaP (TraB family)